MFIVKGRLWRIVMSGGVIPASVPKLAALDPDMVLFHGTMLQ